MLSSSRNIAILIAAILLLFVGLFFAAGDSGEAQIASGEVVSWEKNYSEESKQPYGTYLFHELLQKALPNHAVQNINVSVEQYFVNDSLQIVANEVTYVFVGKSLNLYNEEVGALLEFVEQGNNLFIAAEHLPNVLLEQLFTNYSGSNFITTVEHNAVDLTFEIDELSGFYPLKNIVNEKPQKQRWYVAEYGVQPANNGVFIGKAAYRNCFVKVPYGEGVILLNTVPQAFTNSFVKSELGKKYAETAVSFFPESTILWDNYTKYIYDDGLMDIDQPDTDRKSSDGAGLRTTDTFKFLLSNKYLLWAYLIILVGIALFVIFRGKREQKIIPTVARNKNTSLEFTQTLARLYRSQNQHNKLIAQMEQGFKVYVKDRYYILYSEQKTFIERLSKKSGFDEDDIQVLLDKFKAGKSLNEVSDAFLVNLYIKLNEFYKKAK